MIRPRLDVSRVLTSPYFRDEFKVVRRLQGTNSNGEPVILATTTFTRKDGCIGVVVPSGDTALVRADAYEAQGKSLQVITKFRLSGPAKRPIDPCSLVQPPVIGSYFPDLVLWSEEYYVVRDLSDYSRFGVGFVVADCLLYDYIPVGIPDGKR